MMRLAIIPARGGSKRLPRKNILPIQGKPMLFYCVQAALKTGLFDQVIVSTEDDEIARVAQESGAKVMPRPAALARDEAGVVQVCSQVLETLDSQGIRPGFFCCIYATAIFITSDDIKDAFKKLDVSDGPDVVMGVSQFNLQPVQALETKDGFLRHKWPEYQGVQSQFQPKLLASNGTFYWADTLAFVKNKTFYPRRLEGYPIPWIRSIDIDTPEDLKNVQMFAPLILGSLGKK
ncbi:MAG: acylneuraminate cytidylyltransferase family protein [Desulfobacteraceae bacterium]|nr:acylneuraminate cytidylyltransferase family protein [Desulfobacteraceae bacterium]